MCSTLLPPVYHVLGFQILFQYVRDYIYTTARVAAHLDHESANRFAALSLILCFLPFQYFKVVFRGYRLNVNSIIKV